MPITGPASILQILPYEGNTQHQKKQPENQQKQSQPRLPVGKPLTGTITAQFPEGRMTLTLNNGIQLSVQAGKPFPTGTQVTVQITPNGIAEILTLQLPTGNIRADAVTQLGKVWDSLLKALKLLPKSGAQSSQTLLSHIPKANNLLPTLSLFAAAVSKNAPEQLMSQQALAHLKTLGIDFVGDINMLHHLHQKSNMPDHWRGFLFPYIGQEDEDPQQGSFFWRRQENDDPDDKGQLRFVLQLSFSEIGSVQLDGLLHNSHILMKLRLIQPPEPSFEEGLKEIVQKTLYAHGLTGDIVINTVNAFTVDPLTDILHEEHGGYNLTT